MMHLSFLSTHALHLPNVVESDYLDWAFECFLYNFLDWEGSDLGLSPWDWSTRYCTNRRELPSFLDLLSEFGLISDGWSGSISAFGDWANALECWRSPSLRLVIPGIAVSPGLTHSDSRIVFVTGTVVKPQQPLQLFCFTVTQTQFTQTWV